MTTDTRQHWHAVDNGDGGATIKDEHGGYIASVQWRGNAPILASAHDLLAALEALTQLGTDENGAIIIGPRGWEMAQAAINKARGE